MSTLLLSYNPLAIRAVLVVAVILLVLGVLLYQIHVRSIRRRQARRSAHTPTQAPAPQESGTAQAEHSAHVPEPAPAPQIFRESVRPSSPILRDFGRLALILLAFCVAAGLVVVLMPQSTIDRLAQNFRLRNPQAIPQEKISLLYLGDETQGKEFHIRGVIRNISTEPIDKIDATVRLYAPDGSLLETMVVRMDAEQIAPDATASFHLTYPDYNGQFGSYSVDFKLRQGDSLPYKDMRRDG